MHGSPRVLIIDDEYKTLEILGMRLSQDGFEVTTATTGEAGLKLVYETHPDAILLDIMMPGMSGMEMLKQVREIAPNLIVIIITGYATVELSVQAIQQVAHDFIAKPFTSERLSEVLWKVLKAKKR